MGESCGWPGSEQIYVDYHDHEWGMPEYDSRALWEKLILDGFQAGLSWITILKKRENVIAEWGEEDVLRLLQDKGIIRHRAKSKRLLAMPRRDKLSKRAKVSIPFYGNTWMAIPW